tara:strand:- start:62 stop:1375 length:1314 start_codon:yes stop_codon:yes gene_type:complete
MGVIKKYIFIFLLFLASVLSGQVHDTIYFSERKFVKHVVQGGESLKSIASLHNVATSDIRLANELERRLYYNQMLYIPIYLNEGNHKSKSIRDLFLYSEKTNSTVINIALLLPYYLVKNDTMFNKDSLEILDRYYNKSEAALSFHIGVELAIDSLRRAGKRIILHTFDTNQDSIKIKQVISSNRLQDMDIIIGPMYSSLFQILCKKYGQDSNKILISPLSRDNAKIKKFSSVYQVALTYRVQADLLIDHLIKNKFSERIIIFSDSISKGLAAYAEYKFKEKNKLVDSYNIDYTQVDSIRKYFIESQNILLLSRNKAFLSTMLGSIGGIDSVSTVFSFESIMSYDNLDITNLMELDVHIPNSRTINLNSTYDVSFQNLFEQKYATNVRKYSKQGYDIVMHFCGSSNVYDFKLSNYSYNENIFAPIYHYSDYKLIPFDN